MKQKFLLTLTVSLLILSTQTFAWAQEKVPAPGNGLSSGMTKGQTTIGRRAGRINTVAIPVIEKDFEEALRVIQENYVDRRGLDYNKVFKSSILGMLRSLDPHSSYYDREEYEELKTDQRSEYFGIGASIQNFLVRDTVDTYITSTFRGSPAWRGGLRYGDRIIAVDSVKVTGKSSLEVRNRIRGPRGSTVRVTVERASDKKAQVVSITRDAVAQPSVPDAYMIRPGVGYIDMTRGFNYTTSDELREALDFLQHNGAKSLVLDLRDNPGGFLDQAIRVAEVFLPYGQLILTQKGRNGLRDHTYRSRNRSPNSTPLVILINESTASASEIVAGAMQDHDRALIVGETSFGKGLVQSIIPLDYGGGLTLTSAKYYTPSGRLIQRDYSDHSLYDYFTQGGSRRTGERRKPVGPERKTDTGRAVFGGGGITPDEPVNSRSISAAQRRLVSPLFAFTRDLVNGRITGMGHYRVPGGINFSHELQEQEYRFDSRAFKAFEDYLSGEASLAHLAPLVQRNRSFIQLQLRYNVVTAAYGRTMADRVFVVGDDEQIARAIEMLPRAKDLAMAAMSRR
ncbi:MAG TPA: S41 family peptidase [Pyrinomonadaceae bacterium]